MVLTKLGEPARLAPSLPHGNIATLPTQQMTEPVKRELEEMISRQLSALVHQQEMAKHDIGFAINQGHETALKLDALAQAVQRLETNLPTLEEMISRKLPALDHRQEVALHDIGFAINQGHETALKLDALAQAVQGLGDAAHHKKMGIFNTLGCSAGEMEAGRVRHRCLMGNDHPNGP